MCDTGGAEATTLQRQAQFALHATNSLIWSVDVETNKFITGYGPFESLLGYPVDEIDEINPFFEAVVHPDDLDRIQDEFAKIIRGEIDQVRAPFRTHPDYGEVRWYESHAVVQTLDDGTRQLTGITTDITEHKRRETELKAANDRLEEFASILSHDIRSPLSVAVGKLTLAKEQTGVHHIDDAIQALERIESLVDELRAAVKQGGPIMRGGEVDQPQEPIELAAVAKHAWENVATTEQELTIETAQQVRADCGRLKQLFENLFRNAVDHAEPEVTITVGEIDSERGFYVADDGPGLPEDTESLFEAGYSTEESGTGLGLHIVEGIVNAHDWEIEFTDSTDGGARFEITDLSGGDG